VRAWGPPRRLQPLAPLAPSGGVPRPPAALPARGGGLPGGGAGGELPPGDGGKRGVRGGDDGRVRRRAPGTGAWWYRRLFWEAGVLGQALYLGAEAAGLRGTGIGCYFADAFHDLLALAGDTPQDLYHSTVGGPVEDPRLRTLAPYAHLAGAGRGANRSRAAPCLRTFRGPWSP
jgi:hypothetical protein